MEYAEKGSLTKLLKSTKHLPIETCRFVIAEIILALEHLHKENVSHRDLKPENILVDQNYHVKLCDFGEAKIINNIRTEVVQKEFEELQAQLKKDNAKNSDGEDSEPQELEIEDEDFNSEGSQSMFEDFIEKPADQKNEQSSEEEGENVFEDMFNRATNYVGEDEQEARQSKRSQSVYAHRGTFVGTPLYVSPEMLTKNTSGPFIDMWALGVIVYQIITNELPWKGLEYQLYQQIKNRQVQFPNDMPLEAVNLIDALLQLNPLKRLGSGSPEEGLDFAALKSHEFFKGLSFDKIESGIIQPPFPKDTL